MTSCNNCNKEYKSKRKTSKFCSSNCRVLNSRVSVTRVSVTERTCEGVHPIEKCLDKKDWKDIIESRLPAGQFYKLCSTNYALL